ncbi:MAG: BamA/TamA family outer membrane protein [Vicinamibacteria bacterium]|nr:BamA/TamA family outer membrane protein [Vicinamibacteria bacterium]
MTGHPAPALWWVLSALAVGSPAPVLAQGSTVSSIEIRGSSDPSLVRHLNAMVGEAFDPEAIRSSVLLLSAMDLFDEVSVEQEIGVDGTLRVVFNVAETPRLGNLRFVTRFRDGDEDVPLDSGLAKALSSAAALRPSVPFRDKARFEASARMTEWLRSNGYPLATIEMEILPEEAVSPRDGFVRDVRVRVMEARAERLASSRIDGWPPSLTPPLSPAKASEVLTRATEEAWKGDLLDILRKNAYYRAEVKTDSVRGDLVFFVTAGLPVDLDLGPLNPKDQLKAKARFAQEGLSQDAIEETISTIESDYVKRGYRNVVVEFQEQRIGERMAGSFVVRSGSEWVLAVAEYRINGVVSAPPWGALAVGEPWLDANIDAEKERLRAALVQQGHAGALVSTEESGEPGGARVTFNLVPGALTTVESVVIEGAPALDRRSRSAVTEFLTRETAPFRSGDVARDRTALLTSLRDEGYVDVQVEATADYSDDRTRVAVVFHVTPGPRVRVGRIVVVGLKDTRESVILRESRVKEGDFLSYQRLLDTQSALSATGLFANVQIRELADSGDKRNLIIEVTEGIRTTIVPGLGLSETEKVRASLELTRLNISGRGRSASLFLRGSIRGSRALVSLTEPYAFRRRQAVNVQLYAEDDRSRDAFDFHRVGFQPQTIFPLRSGNILAKYTFQKTTTSNVAQDCAEVNRDLCDGKVSGPSLGFIHDTRNDAIDPRRGGLFSVETLLSLSSLGGDSFLKTSAFAARYEEVRAGFVLAGSARLGLSRAFGPSAELPLPERFFAGGSSLMRGFKTDEVGPGQFNEAGVIVPEGGNALVAAALEARLDVTKAWGFQIFAEVGNVFARVSEVRLGNLRRVAGVGLGYRSPFGPLRLDWGFKLDRRPEESRHELHLGVGYAF